MSMSVLLLSFSIITVFDQRHREELVKGQDTSSKYSCLGFILLFLNSIFSCVISCTEDNDSEEAGCCPGFMQVSAQLSQSLWRLHPSVWGLSWTGEATFQNLHFDFFFLFFFVSFSISPRPAECLSSPLAAFFRPVTVVRAVITPRHSPPLRWSAIKTSAGLARGTNMKVPHRGQFGDGRQDLRFVPMIDKAPDLSGVWTQ